MSRKAMQVALEALESKYIVNCGAWRVQQDQAITALRQALETEREWVGLTNDEIEHIADSEYEEAFVRMIEAKLREKNQ